MRRSGFFLTISLLASLAAFDAPAQVKPTVIINGNVGKLQITEDQKLMIEASQRVLQRDLAGAEALYTQAITLNHSNIDAYLQRATVRREMGNQNGMAVDARTAVSMANTLLQQNPRNAHLYYQRGTGFRLLRDYDQAAADIKTAIRLSRKSSWQTDLQAIEIERKTAGK